MSSCIGIIENQELGHGRKKIQIWNQLVKWNLSTPDFELEVLVWAYDVFHLKWNWGNLISYLCSLKRTNSQRQET